MPELPDVQVFKEYIDATCLHQRIQAVHLYDADDLLKGISAGTLRRRLKGWEPTPWE
jgi:formamidopyrimidine-DNA glycosylase